MTKFLPIFIMLWSIEAFGLGPISNGTYSGMQYCSNQKGEKLPQESVTIYIYNNTMTWGPTLKRFTEVGGGFVKLAHYSMESGSEELKGFGHGYFTKSGLHFRVMIDLGFNVVEGEDTFFISDDSLHLVSSAMGLKCEGVFTRQ